ncbi:MAG TPA: glycosyltransferase family 4 protein [Dictyoglomaceae bacterium]|nr:glycosyltransferase family 4 protein [Dictyoglomaceae bacterium]HPP15872.1 glycosyltransferase family 4 protein [Dictyoglomaceae bacterium]HPU44059.1 glycosyltransferase family 4 protein [Dictyoglomaceae bacterium]
MKVKVLYLLPYFNLAGTETHVVELAKALKKDFDILVTAPKGEGVILLEENSIPYREIPYLTPFNIKRYKEALREITNEFNPDIIHVHGAHELVYITKGVSPKTSVVFTCHGYASNIPYIDYKISTFINQRWADLVICVSDYDRRIFKKMGLCQDKVLLIYNGISEIKEEYPLPINIDGFIIGTAARLTKKKGINYLIEAFSLIAPKYKDLKLVIIGDGEERKNLEALSQRLNIKEKVFFLGALPNAKYYFKNFDIFVLPSLSEVFGIVILEAISQKIPVIATNVGGIPEIIEDGKNGILVKPKDSKSLSTALEMLIIDKDLRIKIGEEGYKRYLSEFTFEKMVEKTKIAYESLLNSSKYALFNTPVRNI